MILEALLPALCTLGLGRASWNSGPDMPRPSGGHAAAFLDGGLYVVGGTNWVGGEKFWLDDWHRYDAEEGKWSHAGRLPTSIAYGATASDGERLFVCGGADGMTSLRSCVVLAPAGDGPALRCEALPPLPEARVYAGGAVCEGVLYVIGGAADFGDLLTVRDTVYALSLDEPRAAWQEVTRLPSARCLSATASAGGAVLVLGGCRLDARGDPLNLGDCWAYDPAGDSWERLADLPQPARGVEAAGMGDGGVVLFGGYSATAAQAKRNGPAYGFRDEVLALRTPGAVFEQIGRIPYPAVSVAPVVQGRTVYLTGGEHRMRDRRASLSIGTLR